MTSVVLLNFLVSREKKSWAGRVARVETTPFPCEESYNVAKVETTIAEQQSRYTAISTYNDKQENLALIIYLWEIC